MIAALTGAGLSAAAGLNAFIPLVLVGMFARFSTFIELPENLMWLQEWPTIIVGLILLAAELVLDKIPGVDHVNDLIQTAVRPLVGGVIFAAMASASELDGSSFWAENPLIAGVTGAIVAFLVHTGKATSRPAVNAATGGTGAPLASFAEDALAVGLSLIAIFVPMLVTVLLVGIAGAVYYIVTTGRRRRRNRELRLAQEREERKAALERGEKVAWWKVSWRERLERSTRADGRLSRAGRSLTRRGERGEGEPADDDAAVPEDAAAPEDAAVPDDAAMREGAGPGITGDDPPTQRT